MKVSFPRMGWYTDNLVDYLHELDLDVVDPPPITDTTIALGTRHAGAEMLCFPYKVTLGSIIECVRAGATHVLQYNAGPDTFCRQKQFHRLAADTIHRMGMDFTMVDVSITDLIAKMVKLSGKSWGRVFRITLQHLGRLEDHDAVTWDKGKLNIGVIGEVYCCGDDKINLGLYQRLERYGAHPVQTVTVSDFFHDTFGWDGRFSVLNWLLAARGMFTPDPMKPYRRAASDYFEGGKFAGHATFNIANLLWLRDNRIDGIIHMLPLSCMPETTIACYVDAICSDAGLPCLRVELDETNSEANLDTRLEVFCNFLKRKKEGKL